VPSSTCDPLALWLPKSVIRMPEQDIPRNGLVDETGVPLSLFCVAFIRILQMFFRSLRDSHVLAVEVRNDCAIAPFRCWESIHESPVQNTRMTIPVRTYWPASSMVIRCSRRHIGWTRSQRGAQPLQCGYQEPVGADNPSKALTWGIRQERFAGSGATRLRLWVPKVSSEGLTQPVRTRG